MHDVDLEAIRRLLGIADAYHLKELVVEEGEVRVTIRHDVPLLPAAPAAQAPEIAAPEWSDMEEELEEESTEDPAHHLLRSPMTGVFYRSSSPDSPPYVVEGQTIAEGQTIGLIEAMKVFSEIPADVSGVVTRIAAETGKLLQEGDVLLVVDTLG